jgi:hypothetical protein
MKPDGVASVSRGLPESIKLLTISGQGEPVTATVAAATRTPVLPITSFREQTHADRRRARS